MRDVIWTIVLVWLVYKLVDVFKSIGTKRSFSNEQNPGQGHQNTSAQQTSYPKRDIKGAIQKHLNNDGEYVDFEEVK